jgi:hypothetical protein
MEPTEIQAELFPDPEQLPPYTYIIPPNAKQTTCGCGAAIVFVTTPRSAQMPLALSTAYNLGGRRVAVSHYRNCPYASGYGKRGYRD